MIQRVAEEIRVAPIWAPIWALSSYRSMIHRVAEEVRVAPIWHLFGTYSYSGRTCTYSGGT